MQRILIQAAPCCQGNSKCLLKHGDGNAGLETARIQKEKRAGRSDECPSSEGHSRNASVLSRCAKSSSTDRLTCKHTGSSAGSHTLTYMLHLAETERKREGRLMRERWKEELQCSGRMRDTEREQRGELERNVL